MEMILVTIRECTLFENPNGYADLIDPILSCNIGDKLEYIVAYGDKVKVKHIESKKEGFVYRYNVKRFKEEK